MAVPYNHKAIEKKWRQKWEENPVNVDDPVGIGIWPCLRLAERSIGMEV